QGDTLWYVPLSWFARGLAGRAWLPADLPHPTLSPKVGGEGRVRGANTVFVYDLRRKAWTDAWRFPDAVSDLGVHPDGDRALVSCWDGKAYLVGRDGVVQAEVNAGEAARLPDRIVRTAPAAARPTPDDSRGAWRRRDKSSYAARRAKRVLGGSNSPA